MGHWDEMEALEQERFDADLEQASYEAQGRAYGAAKRKSETLMAAGDKAGAAAACPHGGGYPLDSPAASHSNDPYAGESGYRCCDCGSRMSASPWDGGTVTAPCEIEAS